MTGTCSSLASWIGGTQLDSQNSVTGYGPSSLGENGFRNTPIWPGGASRSLAQDAKKAVYMTFLLDQSESMGWEANGHRRFELVNKGLRGTLLELPRQISPRLDLRVRVIGFNNKLHNRSAGYQPIKSLADRESVFLTERDCASTTSLWGAINYALTDLYETFDRARKEGHLVAKPILVVFTDGKPEGNDPVSFEELQRGIAYHAVREGATICFITAGDNGDMDRISRIATSVCRKGEPDVFTCDDSYADVARTFEFLTDSLSGTIGTNPSSIESGGAGEIV